MSQPSEPRIISAERGSGGVLITFSNGKCALYGASLLYSVLPHAELLPDCDAEES